MTVNGYGLIQVSQDVNEKETDMTDDITNEETVQEICQFIDNNICCSAEEHCRALGYQLDRIENQQRYLREWVNETLNPAVQEIRDALRQKKETKQ